MESQSGRDEKTSENITMKETERKNVQKIVSKQKKNKEQQKETRERETASQVCIIMCTQVYI